jgi:hypothetical protein
MSLIEFLSSREAAQAIVRERKTRHWTNGQRREHLGESWPSETARITAEADAAVDWFMEALAQIRSAWNHRFRDCPAPLLPISPPTVEEINSWLNSPSDTASALPTSEIQDAEGNWITLRGRL